MKPRHGTVMAALAIGLLAGCRGASAPVSEPSAGRVLDVEQARAKLHEVDVAKCWPMWVAHLEGDVQVTFKSDGTVARVGIPSPSQGATLDTTCVASLVGEVVVDAFDGDPVVVTVKYGLTDPSSTALTGTTRWMR